MASPPRLPILESLSAVVAVGLVAGLMAFPSSSGSTDANVELMDRLGTLRTAVFRFSMEHSGPDGAVNPGQQGLDVAAQLTGRTRSDGSTEPSNSSRDDRWLGPYIRRIPENPVNQLDSIRVERGDGEPILTGEAGWAYQPTCGKMFPDLPGVDPRGVPYSDY